MRIKAIGRMVDLTNQPVAKLVVARHGHLCGHALHRR